MVARDKTTSREREQTDESLRAERAQADSALMDKLSSVDDAADEVIERARARADALLVASRQKVDHSSRASVPPTGTTATVAAERSAADEVLREERALADEVLRVEREDHVALLVSERAETDKDLSHERTQADQAVATRDEFLGIVSHDLRNMLGAILGFSALIAQEAKKPEQPDRILTYAQRILRSGTRMNRLVGDLVDLASIQAGSLLVSRELGDPLLVVAEAIETLHAQAVAKDVSLESDISSPIPPLPLDSARILQVLINLVSNAIKFTSPGGRVIVHAVRTGEEVAFAVSDTGKGILPDNLEAIFERYFQVALDDKRGVGLGLYISKCIVHGHGGKIWAESELDKGSTFHFTLPLS